MANPELAKLWPEAWAGHVFAQAASIRAEAEVAFNSSPSTAHRTAALNAIEGLLVKAEGAAQRVPERRRRRSFTDRWRGTSVEWAHSHLHAAKTILTELLPEVDVDARIPAAIARIDAALDPQDVRRLQLAQLDGEKDRSRKRAGLKQALEIGYDASDQLHSRVRGFRNILYKAGAAIALFMSALVIIVWQSPASVPFCFDPTMPTLEATRSDSEGGELTAMRVCPSGEDRWVNQDGQRVAILQEPRPQDVLIVAGLGLLGGALSAAFAIRKVRGTSTPYDVPLALAVLKVPIGALTAVAGMLLLGGGFVPGLSQLDSQGQILAYALLFGYAQQVGTQFIDQRAQNILNSVPSKDAQSKPATPSVPTMRRPEPIAPALRSPAPPVTPQGPARPTELRRPARS